MRRTTFFILSQAVLIVVAALAYFAVRGLTEQSPATARSNAERLLDLERRLAIDLELGLQALVLRSEWLVDLANWIYIWGHWPVIVITLFVLAVVDRPALTELRNAMFISGAIGLVIFATFAVTPPRLFAPEYVDTVTVRSSSYRVLQPPSLINKYAAVPSLHFGWNLLVGLTWRRTWSGWIAQVAGIAMPVAMGFAVVATANHWTLDVVLGGLVALTGLALERQRARRWTGSRPGRSARSAPAAAGEPSGDEGPCRPAPVRARMTGERTPPVGRGSSTDREVRDERRTQRWPDVDAAGGGPARDGPRLAGHRCPGAGHGMAGRAGQRGVPREGPG